MIDLVVEGWRFIPHSYSIINQFQCLEFLKRSDINLWHQDTPYFRENWQPTFGLLDQKIESKLNEIPMPLEGQKFDVTLRMGYPFDFSVANSEQTFIFGTTEMRTIFPYMSPSQLKFLHHNSSVVILTSSHWSREGFVYGGADPERTIVVPLGVDPEIFHPLSTTERTILREKLGWEGFIFLNTSAMTENKGIDFLIKAFAVIAEQYPDAKLVLKGLDSLYSSESHIVEAISKLSFTESENVLSRLIYIGEDLSFAEMAQLYQAADVYVSPYLAEGFNMPVLEAIACGLPVICTRGGSTDDFTHPDFALSIESQLHSQIDIETQEPFFVLIPELDHLIELMRQSLEQDIWRERAAQSGFKFVRENFTWEKVVDRLVEVFQSQKLGHC